MSTPSLAAPEAVNFETSFHLDSGVEADTYLVIHQLMGRGQLLNAYAAKMEGAHSVEFGQGILNNGKAKGREKRPLTQIEIMAAVEREKTEKKAAKRAVKEAKVEARRAAEDFELNGPNKVMTKKERKRLDAEN
mmetsp:Transcript_3815/g.14113  ORF Transcript_3815/g.14113 Transcript_3815/m.14113 type:complete len:134 (+) Transcript_3815:133-534(+)